MRKRLFSLLQRSVPCSLLLLFSKLNSEHPPQNGPLFAGTQLAFYSTNAAPGDFAVQPYLFSIYNYGAYTKDKALSKGDESFENTVLLSLETGITRFLDISFIMHLDYNGAAGRESLLYGDTKVILGLQTSLSQKGTWVPNSRVLIGGSFPTGKYDKLNPKKGDSDISGSGAYELLLIAVISKEFWSFETHPLKANLNLIYTVPSMANVKGFNAYGGIFDTRGSASPGHRVTVNLGLEFSLSHHWAFGADLRYTNENRSTFSGEKGFPKGTPPFSCSLPSSEQFSIAPCLEYSWSENISVTLGAWFTVYGKNSQAFAGGVANVYRNF